jgi:hypothetical protein
MTRYCRLAVVIHAQVGTGNVDLVDQFCRSFKSKPFFSIRGKNEQSLSVPLNDLCDQIKVSQQIQEALVE